MIQQSRKMSLARRRPIVAAAAIALSSFLTLAAAAAPMDAESLVQAAPQRGLCVVLDDPSLELALPLARHTDCLVYVQLADGAAVEAARRRADAAGLYGTRLFIEQGPLDRIHLADHLADLLAAPDGSATNRAEALRVVRPEGVVLLGRRRLVKPPPEGVDDWSHLYHGPDNNPQSKDRVARAPYLTQFLSDPRYAPLPQVAVASAGRVFKVYGHIAFKPREEPLLNTLAAYNGYNGALLWKRSVTPGLMVHRNTIIATPDVLYYADDKSCKLLDPATGRLLDEITPPKSLAGGRARVQRARRTLSSSELRAVRCGWTQPRDTRNGSRPCGRLAMTA